MTTYGGRATRAANGVIARTNRAGKRLRNAECKPAGEAPEVATDFAELDDHSLVETIENPADPTKTLLAIYENGNDVRLAERFESKGRVIVPVPRNRGIFSRMRLPKGVASYESTRSLFFQTGALLLACVDMDPKLAMLASLFVLSSWLPEKLPIAPYLALVGMPRSGKTTLLRLLGMLCRRSILVADISPAAFYQVYEQTTPTMLIDETRTAADQKKLLHLLRSGSTPGFAALRKDSSFNCFGPKAFAWTELPSDRALNTRCIVIPMYETNRTDLNRATDPRILSAAEDLQKNFLQLRLKTFSMSPRPNVVDGVEGLHSRSRDLYEALAYAIADDKWLCDILAGHLSQQEQFTREPLPVRHAAVLKALAGIAHAHEQATYFVADVATFANRFLENQGENVRLTPHAVGDVLTSLGIENRRRTSKGWMLDFDQGLSKKIHLLIKRYGADCYISSTTFEASPNCPLCKEVQLDGLGVSYQAVLPGDRASSDGRCNTCLQFTRGSLKSQRFSWALIQAQRDLVEMRLRIARQVGSSREVLPQQQVGVFVRATLPGTLRIAEVDLHIRSYRKVLVFGHLQSAIPGQRAPQGSGEFTNMPTQCRHDHGRVFAGHFDQHGKT